MDHLSNIYTTNKYQTVGTLPFFPFALPRSCFTCFFFFFGYFYYF